MTESRSDLPLPFERSYWVSPGRLMAGAFPGSLDPAVTEQNLRALAACGIRHTLSLMEENETNTQGQAFAPYDEQLQRYGSESGAGIVCERHAVRDLDVPTVAEMQRILDTIDGAIARQAPLYLHCWGGKGRTGTVVGCWLVRHGLAEDGDEALRMIEQMRSDIPQPRGSSPETPAQFAMVRGWKRGE
jgi:hypothetical protein